MKILVCVGNKILAEGLRRIITENLTEAVLGDMLSGPTIADPDLVLFDSREKIDVLMRQYEHARFVCIDLGLREPELACLLLCHDISGIISPHLSVEMFCKALDAVHRGEIWVEQTHLKAVLYEGRGRTRMAEIHGLSDQDKQIVRLIARGYRNRDIADQLCLSIPTIKAHLSRIYKTLGVENRAQLMSLATESGWQQVP